jgi:hypothetical protein
MDLSAATFLVFRTLGKAEALWVSSELADDDDLLFPGAGSSTWGRFYETVSAEIYKIDNLVKLWFVIKT